MDGYEVLARDQSIAVGQGHPAARIDRAPQHRHAQRAGQTGRAATGAVKNVYARAPAAPTQYLDYRGNPAWGAGGNVGGCVTAPVAHWQ
jgi:hypothetical protein